MTNFFERPLIPLQPNPEPDEFPLYRDMMFRRIADLQSDPYGGQQFSNRGRGTFDPRSGGYGPSNVGAQGSGGPGGPRTVGPRPTDGGGGMKGGGGGGMDIRRLLQMLAQRAGQQGGGGGQPKPGPRPTGAGMTAAAGHDAMPGPGLPGPYESNFPAGTAFPATAMAGATPGGGGGAGGGGGGGMPRMRPKRKPMTGYDGGGMGGSSAVDDPAVDAVAQQLMQRPALMKALMAKFEMMKGRSMEPRQPMQKMLPRGRSAAPILRGEDGALPGRPGQGGWRDIPSMEREMGNVQGSGYGAPNQQTPNGPAVPRHTNPSAPQPDDPRFSRFTQMNPGAHGATGTTPHYTDPNNPFGTPATPAAVASTVAAGHDAADRVMRGMRGRPGGGGGGRPMTPPSVGGSRMPPSGGGGSSNPGSWSMPRPMPPSNGGWGPAPMPPNRGAPSGRTPADAMAGGGGWGPPSGGFPNVRGL